MDREALVRMKRALIVDDSKSARVVLSRVLEKLELAVDTTESAESALNYLRDNRPDVIFMDQVMSGMDGLQAVQAIKSDPSTASIPIMMYTSQDGELFAGEARALGAAGVLPKLMAPSDISKVLDELKVLRDPEEQRIVGFQPLTEAESVSHVPPVGAEAAAAPPANEPPAPAAVAADPRAELIETLSPLLRDQGTDLRRFVVAALESFSNRVVSDVGARIETASARAAETASAAIASAAQAAVAALPPPVAAPEPPEPVAPRRPVGWMALAAGALVLALGTSAYAWQQHTALAAMRGEADAHSLEVAALHHQLDAARAATVEPPNGGDRVLVPYGEVPLSGDRLVALGKLIADLERRGVAATVTVTSAAGEFCLTGNPAEGYAPAPGEMPANRCDVVGNPFDEALKPEQREPAAATTLAASALAHAPAPIEVKFAHLAREQTPTGYPVAADVSAAQWNGAASSHNYVEFTVETRHPAP